MRPPRSPNPDDVEAWAEHRQDAEGTLREALAGSPDPEQDLMGAIAWRAVIASYELRLLELVQRAQAERWSWREITVALGEPEEATPTVQSRWTRRINARPKL